MKTKSRKDNVKVTVRFSRVEIAEIDAVWSNAGFIHDRSTGVRWLTKLGIQKAKENVREANKALIGIKR